MEPEFTCKAVKASGVYALEVRLETPRALSRCRVRSLADEIHFTSVEDLVASDDARAVEFGPVEPGVPLTQQFTVSEGVPSEARFLVECQGWRGKPWVLLWTVKLPQTPQFRFV